MKRQLILFFILAILLAACADEGAEEQNEPEENVTETETEDSPAEEAEETAAEADRNQEDPAAEKEEEEESPQAEPEYYIEEDSSVVPLRDADENVVLLTIDDAPADYTLDMAETLQELDAGAIFFVNGHFLETEEEEEALKQLHDMGFIIGNHTDTHPNLQEISEDEQYEEIVRVSDRVEEIIGERPKFFRAPHGVNTDYSEELVAKEGMVLMNWTYGYDFFAPYQDPDKLSEAMITGEAPEADVPYSLLKPGANLLMHDREWTNEALADIVTGLRENGYEIVDPHLIQVD